MMLGTARIARPPCTSPVSPPPTTCVPRFARSASSCDPQPARTAAPARGPTAVRTGPATAPPRPAIAATGVAAVATSCASCQPVCGSSGGGWPSRPPKTWLAADRQFRYSPARYEPARLSGVPPVPALAMWSRSSGVKPSSTSTRRGTPSISSSTIGMSRLRQDTIATATGRHTGACTELATRREATGRGGARRRQRRRGPALPRIAPVKEVLQVLHVARGLVGRGMPTGEARHLLAEQINLRLRDPQARRSTGLRLDDVEDGPPGVQERLRII